MTNGEITFLFVAITLKCSTRNQSRFTLADNSQLWISTHVVKISRMIMFITRWQCRHETKSHFGVPARNTNQGSIMPRRSQTLPQNKPPHTEEERTLNRNLMRTLGTRALRLIPTNPIPVKPPGKLRAYRARVMSSFCKSFEPHHAIYTAAVRTCAKLQIVSLL